LLTTGAGFEHNRRKKRKATKERESQLQYSVRGDVGQKGKKAGPDRGPSFRKDLATSRETREEEEHFVKNHQGE